LAHDRQSDQTYIAICFWHIGFPLQPSRSIPDLRGWGQSHGAGCGGLAGFTVRQFRAGPVFQPAAPSNSETSDPTGLVTARTAIVPIGSPRRYIMYAATAPAMIVPQNNTLFITAP
jgi:hypothetical protein